MEDVVLFEYEFKKMERNLNIDIFSFNPVETLRVARTGGGLAGWSPTVPHPTASIRK